VPLPGSSAERGSGRLPWPCKPVRGTEAPRAGAGAPPALGACEAAAQRQGGVRRLLALSLGPGTPGAIRLPAAAALQLALLLVLLRLRLRGHHGPA